MRQKVLLNILGLLAIFALGSLLVNNEYRRVGKCNDTTLLTLNNAGHGTKAKNVFTGQVRDILTPCYPVWWKPIK